MIAHIYKKRVLQENGKTCFSQKNSWMHFIRKNSAQDYFIANLTFWAYHLSLTFLADLENRPCSDFGKSAFGKN